MAIPGPLARRAITIPTTFATAIALSLVLPVAVPLFVVSDSLRSNRGAHTRAFLTFWVLAQFEMLGLLAAAGVWALARLTGASAQRWVRMNQGLTHWWGNSLLRWVIHIYGLELRVSGAAAVRAPGRVLVLMRHSGVADTLLPPCVISWVNGRPLRYIVKDELLWDPCLDVVGTRSPNVFVDRSGADTAAQVAAVRTLAAELEAHEGLLLYPEGTRFTPKKRARIIEKLRAGGDPEGAARVERLQRVLPPRRGGTLAVLQAAPDADVIIAGNTGFEWATTKRQLWTGEFIGRTLRVDFRRFPAADVPRDDDGAMAWLEERWAELDAWVRAHEDPSAP